MTRPRKPDLARLRAILLEAQTADRLRRSILLREASKLAEGDSDAMTLFALLGPRPGQITDAEDMLATADAFRPPPTDMLRLADLLTKIDSAEGAERDALIAEARKVAGENEDAQWLVAQTVSG